MIDLTGRQIGPYRLESVIGSGPFGRVYLARHTALGVGRAVKVVQGAATEQPPFRTRFLQEAKTAANLFHPNIVPVHDFGVESGVAYLVMEHVESAPLGERLERLPVPQRSTDPTVHTWIRDMAAALDHAHSFGVIHRDLKPTNVLVRTRDDRAMLTDFGIARALSDSGSVDDAQAGAAYRSPEQCRAVQGLTTLSDVYSLAAMLYEIATGSPPFGRGPTAVTGHLEKAPPPTRLAGPHLPQAVDAVLAKGLAKAPEDRYRTAGELAAALLAALGESGDATRTLEPAMPVEPSFSPDWVPPVLTHEPPAPPPAPAPRRRLPSPRLLLAALGVAAAAALLVGLGTLGVAAIGRLAAGPAATAPPPAPSARPTAELPRPVQGSMGAPMAVAGVRLTVVSVDVDARPPPSVTVPATSRFVAVEVVYENAGRAAVTVSPFDWTVVDGAGGVYQALERGVAGDLPQSELSPAGRARGVIGFVVPRSAQRLVLTYSAERGDGTARLVLGQ